MTIRPSRALGLLALIGAAGLMPACSSTPPAPAAGSRLAGTYEVNHDAWRTIGYRWEWTSRPPLTHNGVITFADAFEDVVVVQDSGAMVSVIENPTGRIRWNTQVAQTNTRFLGNTRRGDSIVIANETELYELDLRTGNTKDRTPVGGIATTKPVFFGDRAVLATAAGRVVTIDTGTDLRVWEYQFDGLIETPPLRVDDERVAVISTRGEIRTIDVDSARSLSHARISGDAGDALVSDADLLFIGSLDQSVYAYDLVDGARLWRIRSPAPVIVRPVFIDGILYATTADLGLAAIDAMSGKVLWNNDAIGGWVVTTNDDDLMVWTGGDLIRVDAERGDVIASTPIKNISGVRADAQQEGNIFAITAEGAVAKFSPR